MKKNDCQIDKCKYIKRLADPENSAMGVLTTFFFYSSFFFSQRAVRTLPREAIGPQGPIASR